MLLSAAMPGRVEALYVDHKLRSRKELEAEQQLNRANAARLGVPFTILELEVGEVEAFARENATTIEAAARTLRYRLLLEHAPGLVVTAHTADDQAETLLMRLIQGCSVRSLAGIRSINGRIVRPLLDYRREDTEAVCRQNGFTWSDDSTNQTLFCMRNRVRHLFSASLSAESFASLQNIASNVSSFLLKVDKVGIMEEQHYLALKRSTLLSAHPAAQDEALLFCHDRYTSSVLTEGQRAGLLEAVKNGRGYECRYYYLRCAGDDVRFYPRERYFVTPFESPVFPMGIIVSSAADGLAIRIDPSLICGKAVYRLALPDDEIILKDRTASVSSLLSAYHVPYAVVLEDQKGIIAVFTRFLGGRDRLARRFLDASEAKTSIMLS